MESELDNILSKCIHGKERYFKDSTFRVCIDSILTGADEVLIIEQLCDIIRKQSEDFENYMKSDKRPFVIPIK